MDVVVKELSERAVALRHAVKGKYRDLLTKHDNLLLYEFRKEMEPIKQLLLCLTRQDYRLNDEAEKALHFLFNMSDEWKFRFLKDLAAKQRAEFELMLLDERACFLARAQLVEG